MRVVFSPEARQEFEEAEHYYNRQIPQLGSQLRREMRDALPRIRTWYDDPGSSEVTFSAA